MMQRLRLALHVLRGRPLVYRTKFKGEVNFGNQNRNLVVSENDFTEK